MITKNDHYIAAFIGFFIGIFAIPTFYNLGLTSRWVLALLPPAVALIAFLGMRIAERFAGRYLFIAQFTRFLAVGFMNTSLDFGILNLLSSATGVTSGVVVGGVNAPGFFAAILNSYFWNKLWVFKDRDENKHILKDFPLFFFITFIGLILNSGIIILITTYVSPVFGLSSNAWLNFAKVCATALSLFWNFTGYKLFVFKR